MTAFRPVALPDLIGVSVNYYEHHLGDYLKDTLGLSMLQEGAYRRLLDAYYSREQGIPKGEAYLIARAVSRPEKAAVDKVLADFFKLRGGLWIKERCEQEIASAHRRIQAAVENGKKGGRPRNPTGTQQEPTGFHSANPTLNPSESSPVSSLQSPRIEEPERGTLSRRISECPRDMNAEAEYAAATDYYGEEPSTAAFRSWVLRAIKSGIYVKQAVPRPTDEECAAERRRIYEQQQRGSA